MVTIAEKIGKSKWCKLSQRCNFENWKTEIRLQNLNPLGCVKRYMYKQMETPIDVYSCF